MGFKLWKEKRKNFLPGFSLLLDVIVLNVHHLILLKKLIAVRYGAPWGGNWLCAKGCAIGKKDCSLSKAPICLSIITLESLHCLEWLRTQGVVMAILFNIAALHLKKSVITYLQLATPVFSSDCFSECGNNIPWKCINIPLLEFRQCATHTYTVFNYQPICQSDTCLSFT